MDLHILLTKNPSKNPPNSTPVSGDGVEKEGGQLERESAWVRVFKLQAQSQSQNTFLWPVKVPTHPEVNLAFFQEVFSLPHTPSRQVLFVL